MARSRSIALTVLAAVYGSSSAFVSPPTGGSSGLGRRPLCVDRPTPTFTSTQLFAAAKKGAKKGAKKAKKAKKKAKGATQKEVATPEPMAVAETTMAVVEEGPPPTAKATAPPTATATRRKKGKIKGMKPEMGNIDLTGGRPGAIIESEEELILKEEILREMKDGTRNYPDWIKEFDLDEELDGSAYDNDDPEALDSSKLADWNILDLKSKFDYELDPSKGDPDPNEKMSWERYLDSNPVDEEGIELGWTPEFGSSNPVDDRTIVGTKDSYVVDPYTRDESKLTPEFHSGDLEETYNEEIRTFRKSLDIIETYNDPFLGDDIEVPRHVAKWHGLPERLSYPEQPYENNRFTKEGDFTPFDEYSPHKARTLAVQYARANNCEWLPVGKSKEYHDKIRAPYEAVGTLVGTLRRGYIDEDIKAQMEPALKVLGSCCDLLSMEGEKKAIFRFKYYGLIKNKFGCSCWAQTLIRECGLECDNVIFETGFRKRDPWYDGGNWHEALAM